MCWAHGRISKAFGRRWQSPGTGDPNANEAPSSAAGVGGIATDARFSAKVAVGGAAERFQSEAPPWRAWPPRAGDLAQGRSVPRGVVVIGSEHGRSAVVTRADGAVKIAEATSGSVIRAMTRKRPPHGHARASMSWTRRRSVAQSMRVSRAGGAGAVAA
jgi:hypothetical protein